MTKRVAFESRLKKGWIWISKKFLDPYPGFFECWIWIQVNSTRIGIRTQDDMMEDIHITRELQHYKDPFIPGPLEHRNILK